MGALVECVLVDKWWGYLLHTAGRFRNETGQIGATQGGKGVGCADFTAPMPNSTVGDSDGMKPEIKERGLLNVWNAVK